jgi:signal transduction histidine kinase
MQPRSIRFRITAIATIAVAGVLIVGAVAVVLLQRNGLTASLDEALTQRADDIVALIETGATLPDQLAGGANEGFAQLVGYDGEVVIATPNLSDNSGLLFESSPGSGDTFMTVDVPNVDDDMFRVLSREVAATGILYVGTTYDVVSESAATLVTSLAWIIPVLVVALGALVWWLVGTTLQPVENMRLELAEIGATDLERRVPRPGTDDEIDRLAETMNEMLARLESAIERQHRFVADASHELRSPLTRIRSELEVDLAGSTDLEHKGALEGLLDEVVGMQHMVGDLLFLARSDTGNGPGFSRRLDLDDLVLKEARRIQSHERVAVDLSAVSGAHVVGDAGQLTRAIRNLLDNAERHAVDRVTLSLEESGDMAILVVADDGPGIPEVESDRVFERFTRVDAARSAAAGGTGLGLAISREIVERHQGTVSLLPSDGSGARFEVRIPLAE